MKKEEWRFVPGYEGLYMVSNWGRVKSMNYNRTGKERILKLNKTRTGYLIIALCKDGIRKSFSIHTLVYDAFGSGKRNGRILQVDHLDGNKENNHIENLQLLNNRKNVSKGFIQKKCKTSKYTGVTWGKLANKWRAVIDINKKRYNLGSFFIEKEAGDAYQYALTHQEEIINRPSKKTSKYKGVHWSKNVNKWQAKIGINKKYYHLGYFSIEKEAAEAYLKAKENLNPEN